MSGKTWLAAMIALLPALAHAQDNPSGAPSSTKPDQLILVSFDGAHDLSLWNRSRRLAARTGAHFTYFLSCTFLMSQAERAAYQAPGQKKARSNTGFALTQDEAQARVQHVWQAHLEGHEMASHACGHFDGKDWSKAEWTAEFANFDRVLANAWRANDMAELEPSGWQDFVKTGIKGFRAPYLSIGPGLLPALKVHGFAWDASLSTLGPQWPQMDGMPRFGLPRIPEGPNGRRIIAMDYNLFVRHSGGKNAPDHAEEYKARTLAAFRQAFNAEYHGQRRPLQLGFHFVLMNGGAYWDALETFVSETCNQPGVACVTYSQALARMEAQDGATKKADESAF